MYWGNIRRKIVFFNLSFVSILVTFININNHLLILSLFLWKNGSHFVCKSIYIEKKLMKYGVTRMGVMTNVDFNNQKLV